MEYWIADPQIKRVTIMSLVNGLYEEAVFEESQSISSTVLQVYITPKQIFDFMVN